MTTTVRAAEIRKALKAKGWSSRQVSVVSESYSMGSSIRVTIKDPAVPFSAVKVIAEPHESIRYCEVSGEILSGGNRYVSVGYSDEAMAAFRAKYLPAVNAAVAKITGNALIPIEGTPFLVGLDLHYRRYSLWGERHIVESYGPEGIAEKVGALMADEAAREEVLS